MITILRWEIFKLMRQSSTYYALLAVLIIEIFVMLTAYFQGRYILDTLLDSLQDSFIFEGDLLNGNLINYIILNSLWFHIPLILMIVTSGIAANEFKDGTEQTSLLQGVSRVKYISGKYLASTLFAVAILVILALTTMGISYSIFGKGDLVVYYGAINIFESGQAFLRILGAFLSGANTLVFYAVVSVTMAIIVREPSKAWILSGLFLIISALLLKVEFSATAGRFLFFKLTDTWQLFFDVVPNIKIIILNNLCLLVYSTVIAMLGTWIYKRKEAE